MLGDWRHWNLPKNYLKDSDIKAMLDAIVEGGAETRESEVIRLALEELLIWRHLYTQID